jgi:hypothetical protein
LLIAAEFPWMLHCLRWAFWVASFNSAWGLVLILFVALPRMRLMPKDKRSHTIVFEYYEGDLQEL